MPKRGDQTSFSNFQYRLNLFIFRSLKNKVSEKINGPYYLIALRNTVAILRVDPFLMKFFSAGLGGFFLLQI